MDSRDKWFQNRRYVPAFMRDFHDGKDLFKALDSWDRERRAARAPAGVALKPLEEDMHYTNWVNAQIYVMDNFLPFMAAHGYTLQRTRMKFKFADVAATVKEYRDRMTASFRDMLQSRFGQSSVPENHS